MGCGASVGAIPWPTDAQNFLKEFPAQEQYGVGLVGQEILLLDAPYPSMLSEEIKDINDKPIARLLREQGFLGGVIPGSHTLAHLFGYKPYFEGQQPACSQAGVSLYAWACLHMPSSMATSVAAAIANIPIYCIQLATGNSSYSRAHRKVAGRAQLTPDYMAQQPGLTAGKRLVVVKGADMSTGGGCCLVDGGSLTVAKGIDPVLMMGLALFKRHHKEFELKVGGHGGGGG